ncbi:toll-like receptor 2 type-2 [Pholidichthys leucotaenia]
MKNLKKRAMKLVTFVLIFQSFSFSTPQCHSCEETYCNCSGQSLKKVPAPQSKLITELDLSFNSLEEIIQDDLLGYASLRSLLINNNKIKVIEGETFDPLTTLEKLDLSFNQLDELSSQWFKKLFSLQYLFLQGNKYTTLGDGNLFQSLRSLKAIHLGGPFLQSVNKNDFSGLFSLDELFVDGKNLHAYAKGSLREIGPIGLVTLALNNMFQRSPEEVRVILSEVGHPNTTLTFADTLFYTSDQMSPLGEAFNLGVTSIIFKSVNITTSACVELLNLLSGSRVTVLALEDIDLLRDDEPFSLNYPLNLDSLEVVSFRNMHIDWFYNFPALIFLHSLLHIVQKASLINSMLFAIPCKSSSHLINLEFFDISYNIVTDIALREMMCNGSGVFQNLQTFNISRNLLQSINSQLFTKLNRLKNIDMSGNLFQTMPERCHWPASLQFLNLASAHLTKVTPCLPESLQILDLSNNELTVFDIQLPSLKELYISGNKIGNLPDGTLYPRLALLSIQNNNLQAFSSKTLSDYKNLTFLEAGGNPYVCSCDFVAFLSNDMINHKVSLRDKFNSYICESDDTVRGQRVVDVSFSLFECDAILAFSLLCIGILVLCMLIAGLCYKFSVVWYVRMMWAWLKAKRKPKLKKGALEYDAFVSYSENDSGWVEANLVPGLEQSEPPLKLCLHKRDFVPGGWILDNIMDAIEKSNKTLFILSHNFVKSEWCKYELDYTHFRLFDQNDDAVVLILLEPIDKNNIPKKFCRLRKIMNSRTYLEWPDDDAQIPAFWQSLRTAIKRPETVNENPV